MIYSHMSDIVCNYKIQNTDQSGYFLLDTNSTLRPVKAFVSREFLEGARPLRISSGEKVLKNDHDLQQTGMGGGSSWRDCITLWSKEIPAWVKMAVRWGPTKD